MTRKFFQGVLQVVMQPHNSVHIIARSSPEAVPVSIDNRSVRKNINFHDVFLDGHRIFKLALAVDEFPKPRHHEIGNLDFSFTFRRENTDSTAAFIGIFRITFPHARHRTLKDRVDENAEAVAVHCQDYLARFPRRIKLDF